MSPVKEQMAKKSSIPLIVCRPASTPATRFMTAKTTRRSYYLALYCLAAAVIGAGVFGMIPGLREVVEYVRFSDAPGVIFVARWALLLLFIGAIQIAYGVYLIPLPDWASMPRGCRYARNDGGCVCNGPGASCSPQIPRAGCSAQVACS